jgi:hypothetical protein
MHDCQMNVGRNFDFFKLGAIKYTSKKKRNIVGHIVMKQERTILLKSTGINVHLKLTNNDKNNNIIRHSNKQPTSLMDLKDILIPTKPNI